MLLTLKVIKELQKKKVKNRNFQGKEKDHVAKKVKELQLRNYKGFKKVQKALTVNLLLNRALKIKDKPKERRLKNKLQLR